MLMLMLMRWGFCCRLRIPIVRSCSLVVRTGDEGVETLAII